MARAFRISVSIGHLATTRALSIAPTWSGFVAQRAAKAAFPVQRICPGLAPTDLAYCPLSTLTLKLKAGVEAKYLPVLR
jgi:hypothetical protein